MRKRRKINLSFFLRPTIFLAILVAVIAVLAVKIIDHSDRLKAEKSATLHREPPAVNVVVQEVAHETILDKVNLPGIVEPWIRLQVLSETQGKVIKVPVKEGDQVQKGDVLALIDAREYQSSLDSAAASYDLAVADLKRAKSLFEKEMITPAEIDQLETRLRTLKAAVETTRLQIERCRITAPITGVVNRLDAKTGLFLSVSDPVAEILQIDRVKVAVGIPESDVTAARKLTSINLTIEALDNKGFTGEKLFLASSPDSLAHLYRLEVALDNHSGSILPGMFARTEILKNRLTNTVVIPLYAVISRRDEHSVYVAVQGKAEVRSVKLGILEGWRVQILEGLNPGDQVIVVGHRDVADGQSINIASTVSHSRDLAK